MKVKELIKKLKKCNPEFDIRCDANYFGNDYFYAHEVKEAAAQKDVVISP